MRTPTLGLLLLLLTVVLALASVLVSVEGGKKKIHITDDLDDVVDDEEDDDWREWGQRRKTPSQAEDQPPPDFSSMSVPEIQEMMMKTQSGPVFGFVKLRLGVPRTPETMGEIAMRWSKLSRTGGVEVRFTGVDLSTLMFNMEQGREMLELKEFILSQSEAYEVKMGDQVFRRPGDPPLEQVIEEIQKSKGGKPDVEAVKEEL